MDDITILECRQKATNTLIAKNGDFETTLNRPLVIEENDVVKLKSCFIDTKSSSSGKIVIDEDKQLIIGNAIYATDWDTTNKTYEANTTNEHPDGKPYIMCKYTAQGDLPGMVRLTGLRLQAADELEDWGGGPVKFTYKNANNDDIKTQVFVPKQGEGQFDPTYTATINIVSRSSTVVIDSLPTRTLFVGTNSTPHVASDLFEPVILSTTITIEKGNYEPSALAEKLSFKLSQSSPSGYVTTTNPVDSNFLVTTTAYPQAASASATTNSHAMVAADGNTDVYSIATNTKTYLGTNQVGVEFDESTGRFFIKAIHCPLFYTPGASDAQPSVALLSTNSAAPNTNRAVWCVSNGGILLTRLEPTSFWSEILKLNETSLVTTFEHTDVKSIGGFNSAFPKCSVQAGVNTTDAYLGLDAAIVKSNQFMITPTPPLYSTSTTNVEILAAESALGSSDAGYFLIDITSKMKQNFIGSDYYSSSISGIVSRYYSVDSYTSGSSDAAIPYVHRGAPMMLTSLRVRILDPSNYDAANIGEDNTVFVEVIKAPKGKS